MAPLAPTPTTGGISQPASQPASERGGWRNQPAMPHTTAISQQPAESVSQPASQPARRPAESASQLHRRNQPVMPQTTCRSRRPAESATSPSGGRRNQPKLPAGGRRNQPETCPAAGGKQLRPQDAPPLYIPTYLHT